MIFKKYDKINNYKIGIYILSKIALITLDSICLFELKYNLLVAKVATLKGDNIILIKKFKNKKKNKTFTSTNISWGTLTILSIYIIQKIDGINITLANSTLERKAELKYLFAVPQLFLWISIVINLPTIEFKAIVTRET